MQRPNEHPQQHGHQRDHHHRRPQRGHVQRRLLHQLTPTRERQQPKLGQQPAEQQQQPWQEQRRGGQATNDLIASLLVRRRILRRDLRPISLQHGHPALHAPPLREHPRSAPREPIQTGRPQRRIDQRNPQQQQARHDRPRDQLNQQRVAPARLTHGVMPREHREQRGNAQQLDTQPHDQQIPSVNTEQRPRPRQQQQRLTLTKRPARGLMRAPTLTREPDHTPQSQQRQQITKPRQMIRDQRSRQRKPPQVIDGIPNPHPRSERRHAHDQQREHAQEPRLAHPRERVAQQQPQRADQQDPDRRSVPQLLDQRRPLIGNQPKQHHGAPSCSTAASPGNP
ncbi:hypothetical protein ENSA7_65870 [Enhygromyxa salina]|uniref:Uncharacterized protein n=1 Tax=Enhygromyxa salina TaxID=215803 RepID=A0A2S9XZQ0_9BACT|nr:hypothetical protein ENSA7_65870 [Enhygromyxa salina]